MGMMYLENSLLWAWKLWKKVKSGVMQRVGKAFAFTNVAVEMHSRENCL
jgi:hypothetical protein